MPIITTVAEVPDRLVDTWVQIVSAFNREHPDCQLRFAKTTEMALQSAEQVMTTLDLPVVSMYARRPL